MDGVGKEGDGRSEKPSPRTQQLPLQLSPQDPVIRDGEGRGRGTENKKRGAPSNSFGKLYGSTKLPFSPKFLDLFASSVHDIFLSF